MEPRGTTGGDGVMLISVWTRAVAGAVLARVTMCRAGEPSVVRAVTSPRELHRVVDEWLASLDDD